MYGKELQHKATSDTTTKLQLVLTFININIKNNTIDASHVPNLDQAIETSRQRSRL